MTKARTLANFISDNNEFADGTISVAEVSGAAPLASPSFTGNVGIGVTPATFYGRALHVHDTGTAGANIRLTDSNSGTTGNDGMDIIQINNTSYIINREAGGMNFYTGGELRYTIQGDGTHVFNENSLDSDFRVESDTNSHLLYVDSTNNRVNIGINDVTSSAQVAMQGSLAVGRTSTTTGDFVSGGGGNSAAYNGVAIISNAKSNSSQNNTALNSWIADVGGRAGDGVTFPVSTQNTFSVRYWPAGTPAYNAKNFLNIGAGSTVINEDSNDHDFRVESDTNANALFIDASSNVVDISTNAVAHDSATKLQVSGRVRFGSGFGSETSGMTTPTNSMILTKESFPATSGATRVYGLSAQNSGYTTTGSSAPMAVLLGGWSNGSSYSGGIEYQPSSKELHIMGGTANAQTTFVDAGRLASFGQTQVVYNGGNQNYSDNYRQYAYSESVSSLFNNTTNGQAQQITVGNYLPYQHSIPVVVAFSYNGNGALTYTKFLLVQNDFNSITVQELYTNQSSTGIIQSVTFNTTGSYNTRRLQITAQPASGYPMNVWNCVVYYGVAFH